MLYEKIQLDNCDNDVYLEAYIADKIGDYVRNAILIIPGGGYHTVCANREGEPIAHAFIPHGYNAFVLHYSVKKKPFPAQLIEASRAIKHIRDNAEKYNINKERVFTAGFSAGGHLAACLGTMWHIDEIYSEIDMPYGYNRPDGMILIYPVISYKHHTSSFKNLFKTTLLSPENAYAASVENHVDERTCPAFIMHTSNDQVVDVKNSLVLADALSSKGIEFEMHIYPDAPHGIALANNITKCTEPKWQNPAIEKWVSHAATWADGI